MTIDNRKKLANFYNIDLEKLGFTGLPSTISYFKFEVGCGENDPQIAEVTVRYFPDVKDLESIVQKKYNLVPMEDVDSLD